MERDRSPESKEKDSMVVVVADDRIGRAKEEKEVAEEGKIESEEGGLARLI